MEHETFEHNGIRCDLWRDPSLPYLHGIAHNVDPNGQPRRATVQISAQEGDWSAPERARARLRYLVERMLIEQGR